ncbi:SEL1-like repeat protein [Sulfurovum sp.]|jgi:TPR repeat protein|uniref:SEL1-like repeat protein n=1 Tax=Sulfurovum sp. TaxID=1969726 RepID=UPI002A3617F2|nr:SEL1-like repeat protein [Sulfurovum sp.]MDD3500462.1 SEL1-like repeat protein [Sulfurovum sp.]MDY0402892.1 SEL1-like repeat protein [Sulfurovum sp.]
MDKRIEGIIENMGKIEDFEVYIFLILLIFTLWFIRNTVKYYQGEKKTVKRLHRFAKEGEVESQYQLAKRFQKGNAVKKSCNQAAFWYQKAAYSGDEKAQEHLKLFLEKQKRSRDKNRC